MYVQAYTHKIADIDSPIDQMYAALYVAEVIIDMLCEKFDGRIIDEHVGNHSFATRVYIDNSHYDEVKAIVAAIPFLHLTE